MPLRIDTINLALQRLGQPPLQSEAAPNGPAYVAIYNLVIGSLCSEYPWTFQTGFQQLAQLAQPTGNSWLYAYAMPSDLAGTPRALYNSITPYNGGGPIWGHDEQTPVTDFEILKGVLYSNETQLWMRYTQAPNPNAWPFFFQELAVKLMMAELAIPVAENAPMREQLIQEIYGPIERQGEGGLIAKCKNLDSQGRASRKLQIGANPLVAVRRT